MKTKKGSNEFWRRDAIPFLIYIISTICSSCKRRLSLAHSLSDSFFSIFVAPILPLRLAVADVRCSPLCQHRWRPFLILGRIFGINVFVTCIQINQRTIVRFLVYDGADGVWLCLQPFCSSSVLLGK